MAELAPFSVKMKKNGVAVIENKFVRWEHDPAKGGELTGAYVKNGTNTNLLLQAQSTALCPWVRGGWRQYHHFETTFGKADSFVCEEVADGFVKLEYSSKLYDKDGKTLPSASVKHTVLFHPDGAASHTVKVKLTKDMDLGHIRIGTLGVRDDMDRVAVRPCSQASWAVELQNPCRWIDLVHGKSRSDLPAYRSRYLPLSVTFVKNGLEALEMSMGDDLGAWDNLGNSFPGLAQGSVCEARDPWRYEAVFAPLDSPRAGNIVKKGTYTFTYRLALPFVKKNILPLDLAGGLLRSDKTFEERWPTAADLKTCKKNKVSMLRLHNDGDFFANGIFWRDADYPPYPADEMKKMDAVLENCNKNGITAVPYFSVKEYHPEAPDFEKYGPPSTRRVVEGEACMETFFGTSLFGIQMCLESDWFKVRKKSIQVVMDNHAFNGLYFDWCMGLECINPAHNHGKRHWDNDKLLEFIEWSRALAGDKGKLYLHLTNVPSLALENMGDMILTEETEYFDIFPEMFTPHVHFLNIAPRSICVMLPGATPVQIRKLALVTLLHHATLCVDVVSPQSTFDLYNEHAKDLAEFTKYEHHTAPGEGIVRTDSDKVGMSLYWKGKKGLIVLANLTEEVQEGEWSIRMNGKTLCGTAEVPALDFITIPVEL